MTNKAFISIGRDLGDKILKARAVEPTAAEKAVSIVFGIVAVLKQAGVRVTVPLLEKDEHVLASFKAHDIPITKLKAAVTEANKLSKDDKHKEALEVPTRRRKSDNSDLRAARVNSVSSPSESSEAKVAADAGNPKNVGQDDMFVDDVPSEDL